MSNMCPNCKSTTYAWKFGKLYMCEKCKQHFYGSPPTEKEKQMTAESQKFLERIEERKSRRDEIEKEITYQDMILQLAQEARQEDESKGIVEIEPATEDVSFKPMKSPGRPRKVQNNG